MNFFYEATDSSGQTIMGRLDAANEVEVRRHLQLMGLAPQAVAVNATANAAQSLIASPQDHEVTLLQDRPISSGRTDRGASNSQSSQSIATQPTARAGGIILSGNAARTTAALSQSSSRTLASTGTTRPADVSGLCGVNDRDRLFFFQQLAALVKSGMSIYASLDNLAQRTPNKNLSKVTSEMAEGARTGGRVSDVMERYPKIFEDHIVGLVRAGELGGFLEIALSEIALNYEQNIALFRGAWIPKMMAIQAIYALAIAIPLFHDLLDPVGLEKGFGANLTVYLIHEAILLPLTFLIIQGVKFTWKHAQLPQLRYLRDSWTLRVPPFGDLHRQAALASFIRMLRRLYHAGVSPVPAWEGASRTASNVVIRDRLASSYDLMQKGVSLPDAFAATGLFNGNIEQLLMTGHLSGQVVESLDQIAEFYQDQVDEAAKKAKFGILRIGLITMLILGGITVAWAAKSYFAAIFHFGDSMMPEFITLLRN